MCNNEQRPNCYLPQQLIDAYDAVCPFCHIPPVIEEQVRNTYLFACRNTKCSVMPEGKIYANMLDAAADWRIRVTLTESLIRNANVTAEAVEDLPSETRMSIAKNFHEYHTGIEDHTICLSQ